MKMELTVLNEETGECELDLDDEAKDYLIQLGFEQLILMSMDKVAPNEKL